ncbi:MULTISPECIES: SAVMC3_10250 family protein [Streptomyces]|uniref:SAVMC3_10250 family protein n=1 Tax=Streptomyces TaxID=1883 RepID=UPI0004BD3DEE|nr:SAVMC3_10250 family protein [Streptomyces griseolus]
MQELLYLSDAKLRQFVPEARRRSWIGRRLTALKLSASAASFSGNVEIALAEAGAEQNGADRLASVVEYIDRRAPWYWEPEVRAGTWMYFEAPLFAFLPMVEGLETVLFTDAPPGHAQGHEPAHGTRLLLHGSRGHLLAEVPPTTLRAPGVNRSRLHMAMLALEPVAVPTADQLDMPAPPRAPSLSALSLGGLVGRAQRAFRRRCLDAWVRPCLAGHPSPRQ